MSGLRHAVVRVVGGVSRRTLGLEFDQLLALGCDIVRETGTGDVALTFDDGPSTYATAAVLDALDRHSARATFFMIGKNAERHPDLVREVAARGHAIGCHGHEHLDFHWLTPSRIARDIRQCKDTLEHITGRPVTSLRAPYGHFRFDVPRIARTLGITRLIGWNVAPAWNETQPERVADYITSRATPGSIVLLHDATGLDAADTHGWNRAVVAALDPMLSEFSRRGLRCDAI